MTTPEEQAAEVLGALHQPTERASMFGGYLCLCGEPWLTDRCAAEDHIKADQAAALAPVLRAAERRGAERGWDEGWDERDNYCSEPYSPPKDNPYRERADTYAEGGER